MKTWTREEVIEALQAAGPARKRRQSKAAKERRLKQMAEGVEMIQITVAEPFRLNIAYGSEIDVV